MEKETITWKSESHADIADTAPFRKHVVAVTEAQFARALLKTIRQRGGKAAVAELTEEWKPSGDGGHVYEMRAEITDLP